MLHCGWAPAAAGSRGRHLVEVRETRSEGLRSRYSSRRAASRCAWTDCSCSESPRSARVSSVATSAYTHPGCTTVTCQAYSLHTAAAQRLVHLRMVCADKLQVTHPAGQRHRMQPAIPPCRMNIHQALSRCLNKAEASGGCAPVSYTAGSTCSMVIMHGSPPGMNSVDPASTGDPISLGRMLREKASSLSGSCRASWRMR